MKDRLLVRFGVWFVQLLRIVPFHCSSSLFSNDDETRTVYTCCCCCCCCCVRWSDRQTTGSSSARSGSRSSRNPFLLRFTQLGCSTTVTLVVMFALFSVPVSCQDPYSTGRYLPLLEVGQGGDWVDLSPKPVGFLFRVLFNSCLLFFPASHTAHETLSEHHRARSSCRTGQEQDNQGTGFSPAVVFFPRFAMVYFRNRCTQARPIYPSRPALRPHALLNLFSDTFPGPEI